MPTIKFDNTTDAILAIRDLARRPLETHLGDDGRVTVAPSPVSLSEVRGMVDAIMALAGAVACAELHAQIDMLEQQVRCFEYGCHPNPARS